MQSQSGSEWSPEVIALAHKIHKLNEEIETYKGDRMILQSQIRKLKKENWELKSVIGLLKIKEQHENKNVKDRSTNEMEWGEFTEVPEPPRTDTEL